MGNGSNRNARREKGLRFCGLAPVLMPENYLALYPTPDKAECRTLMERAEPRLAELVSLVGSGVLFPMCPVSMKDRLQSGPVNLKFCTFFVSNRKFAVSEACVSCGKCAQRCPINNIVMTDGGPGPGLYPMRTLRGNLPPSCRHHDRLSGAANRNSGTGHWYWVILA